MDRNQISITTLEAAGPAGGPVANQFFRQKRESDTLAVIYPGLNYTCHMPLLYYTSEALLAHGADVLQLWEDYTQPGFNRLSQVERAARLAGDGQALLAAGQRERPYRRLVLAGKSIGTLTMALMLAQQDELSAATTLWLTPLLHVPQVAEAAYRVEGPALFAGGSQDPAFERQAVSRLASRPNARIETVPGGDHSLNIPGDPPASLQALGQVIQAVIALLPRRA